jgi:hypothetical protein
LNAKGERDREHQHIEDSTTWVREVELVIVDPHIFASDESHDNIHKHITERLGVCALSNEGTYCQASSLPGQAP